MSRSDGYRRFAAKCMKIAHDAEDERHRAIFVQMAGYSASSASYIRFHLQQYFSLLVCLGYLSKATAFLRELALLR
jgi:hypothetical protein